MPNTTSEPLRTPHAPVNTPCNPVIFHNHDVLNCIFSHLDPYHKEDRTACVNASRVCRIWSVPASVAIWSARLRWDFMDLFYIYFPDPPPLNPAGLVDGGKMKEYLKTQLCQGKEPRYDPVAWASFLRCCGRTRELYVPRLETPEALALGLVLRWNEEETLFPSLRSLTWMESPRIGGLLPYLAPPSLDHLKLNLNPRRDILPAEIGRILTHLADASPTLRKMDVENAHDAESFPAETILRHSHIQKLKLDGKIRLSVQQCRALLSDLPSLEDFTSELDTKHDAPQAPEAAQTKPIAALNLKKLNWAGTCRALTALFSGLHAPVLRDLEIIASEPRRAYQFEGHRDLVHTIARTAPSGTLRSLKYGNHKGLSPPEYFNDPVSQEDLERLGPRSTATSRFPISDILRPFFVTLPLAQHKRHSGSEFPRSNSHHSIERLVFTIRWPVQITAEDLARVNTGFAGMRGKAIDWTGAYVSEDRGGIQTVRCEFGYL